MLQRQSGCVLTVFAITFLMTCSIARGVPDAGASEANAEESQIKQLVSNYARSVDEADTTLAAQVWLDSTDVSFIHPLGHERGFDQIKQNVYMHLMGETFSERRLTPHDLSVHVYGDSAWVEFYWDFNAKLRRDGSSITTHGRETQVYWKTPNGWRLVHVHYSGMPVTKPGQGF
jgi:ketosteroid isomerase-like protein